MFINSSSSCSLRLIQGAPHKIQYFYILRFSTGKYENFLILYPKRFSMSIELSIVSLANITVRSLGRSRCNSLCFKKPGSSVDKCKNESGRDKKNK